MTAVAVEIYASKLFPRFTSEGIDQCSYAKNQHGECRGTLRKINNYGFQQNRTSK